METKLHPVIALRMAFSRWRPQRWRFRKYILEPRVRVLEVERRLRDLLHRGTLDRSQ